MGKKLSRPRRHQMGGEERTLPDGCSHNRSWRTIISGLELGSLKGSEPEVLEELGITKGRIGLSGLQPIPQSARPTSVPPDPVRGESTEDRVAEAR